VKRRFEELSPEEVLALAIDVEHRNAERFETLADLYADYDAEVRGLFLSLRDQERAHAAQLEQAWSERYGNAPKPQLGEEDVRCVVEAVDLAHGEHAIFDDLDAEAALGLARRAEEAAQMLYRRAIDAAPDESLRELYEELADLEAKHVSAVDAQRASSVSKKGTP
jgi:rubrerythrin